MDKRVYRIWLSLACTPGSTTFKSLLEGFSSAEEIYMADADRIAARITSKSKDYPRLLNKDLARAEQIDYFCQTKGVGIISYFDRGYPAMLKNIPTPPVLLYYRGTVPDFDEVFGVSIVGTRRLTDYGRKNAFMIAYDMARAGATVISGMAIGVDGVAHAGALAAGKSTVAVIGSGIDVLYPKDHGNLARAIVKDGCVLTEYAPGTKPEKFNFPVRNRIISALSLATVVIEGRERSGAIITARHALEQGRDLYALPGNVGSPTSQLTNLLIKNGARLCTGADDIVRDFEIRSRGKLNPHELAKDAPVSIMDALTLYGVSCVTSDDKIFRPSKKREEKREKKEKDVNKEVISSEEKKADADLSSFDKTALEIYKRIPTEGDCAVESLVGDGLSFRDVMRGLLKLEMGCFIVMLPGERVRRNF
ncbi:MAG: DNA-processing protein DprA [Clostridia bacterium]|nr:DNA-processing protein DprA [Clostridia bacterium]